MKTIKQFQDEYRFLSNFYMAEVEYEGLVYPSSEHAYQAAKQFDQEFREEVRQLKTPGLAKRAGRKADLRRDWQKKKVGIMTEIVRDKFNRHPDLTDMLLATGDAMLEEGNNWGDKFWGMVDGKGANHLGLILMQIRDELRGGKAVKQVEDTLQQKRMVHVVTGDLLEADAQYIVHQTNCVTYGGASGLAAAVFTKYPWSDVYAGREEYGEPGDISVHIGNTGDHYVINLNGQFFPGKPRFLSGFDSAKARQSYFHSALLAIGDLNAESVAFPYKIGCGLAGGDWPVYLKMINDFSNWKANTKVLIYQREGDE
jgi:ribA/ribD-fused uncharacterized protein